MATERTTDRLATDTSWSTDREINNTTTRLVWKSWWGNYINRKAWDWNNILVNRGNNTERTIDRETI